MGRTRKEILEKLNRMDRVNRAGRVDKFDGMDIVSRSEEMRKAARKGLNGDGMAG